jgi:hypothetical protein
VQWFWRALESFNAKEREAFLRFAWGRSRLPLRAEDFSHKFVLIATRGNDMTLPSSHTCVRHLCGRVSICLRARVCMCVQFFQLDVPPYTSYEVLREKLVSHVLSAHALRVLSGLYARAAVRNLAWPGDRHRSQQCARVARRR